MVEAAMFSFPVVESYPLAIFFSHKITAALWQVLITWLLPSLVP
jgi:hypothetical protein